MFKFYKNLFAQDISLFGVSFYFDLCWLGVNCKGRKYYATA